MDLDRIDAYIDAQQPELLKDLATLVAINSERRPATEGKPFGDGAAACLAACVELQKRHGFTAVNHENYVLTTDYAPELPHTLDILAHLDVVPAGEGWQITTPFELKVHEGSVYGRGTSDDKGPALCALYAMKALRECGWQPKGNVRLILGSDEECGSSDLAYYFTKEKSATWSISPDADFPVINIEKGGLHSGFTSSAPMAEQLPRVIGIRAGLKSNVIPATATATLQGLTAAQVSAIADGVDCPGCRFVCTEADGALTVTALGRTGHASTPMNAANALPALLQLLAALPLSESLLHDQLKGIARLFPYGDYYGTALGVDLQDEESGRTTMTLDILNYSPEKGLEAVFDCRACLSANDENTTDVIYERLRALELVPADRRMFAPHCVKEDSFLVQTLLGIYSDLTGQPAKPICIGGGTYVHHIDNGVAFGIATDDIDNRMHGPDEFVTLEQLRFACRAYARAILRLCGEAE